MTPELCIPQENVSPSSLDETDSRDPEQLAARRQHIVTELLDTERTYVAELNQILKVGRSTSSGSTGDLVFLIFYVHVCMYMHVCTLYIHAMHLSSEN